MNDPIKITVNVQGNLLGDEAVRRSIVAALKELGQHHDIHVEWIGQVGHATLTRLTWKPRLYQRRQHPAPFAGPNKRAALFDGRRAIDASTNRRGSQSRRQSQYGAGYAGNYGGLHRSAWRGGRRSGDLHRERRTSLKKFPRRSPTANPMFWLHQCKCAGYPLSASAYLYTRFCPNCGAERTTIHDRRRGAAERRAA